MWRISADLSLWINQWRDLIMRTPNYKTPSIPDDEDARIILSADKESFLSDFFSFLDSDDFSFFDSADLLKNVIGWNCKNWTRDMDLFILLFTSSHHRNSSTRTQSWSPQMLMINWDCSIYFITHRDPFLADLDFSLSCSWPEPDLLAVAAEVAVAEEVAFLRLAAVGVDSSSSPMTATVREKCSLSDRWWSHRSNDNLCLVLNFNQGVQWLKEMKLWENK